MATCKTRIISTEMYLIPITTFLRALRLPTRFTIYPAQAVRTSKKSSSVIQLYLACRHPNTPATLSIRSLEKRAIFAALWHH
jgi:hypothetical protein